MPWQGWAVVVVLAIDFAIKVVAIGLVPRNRRPASSMAWLLVILLMPWIGLPLFLLIGSPYLHGRRNQIQAEANREILIRTGSRPIVPPAIEIPDRLEGAITLNRTLTALPCVTGTPIGLYPGYEDSIAAMTEAVRQARNDVWFAIYILALDSTTAPFFDAMADAVRRGVVVRLMYDHWGSREYPGFAEMNARLTADGVIWHQMLPIKPLQGKWRRPDLRNHRKILVVDGEVAFMGSQNMIDSSYLSPEEPRVRAALARSQRRAPRHDRARDRGRVRDRLAHRDGRAVGARGRQRTALTGTARCSWCPPGRVSRRSRTYDCSTP